MPKVLRRLELDTDVIRLQSLLSSHGYFKDATPIHGIFENCTYDNILLFQQQHIDQDGHPLQPDGKVGEKTWWALNNASGNAQRNHFLPVIPDGLTRKRQHLLALLFEEHAKPVFEVPDGSNKSPDIDTYWGGTGIIGQPWCCTFVSWALHEILGFYPVGNTHHVGVQAMWRAAVRENMAAAKPKPGDVFIRIMSGGKGHTGFVVGVSADAAHIYTSEGNCGNRLKVGKRKKDTIHHFIDCIQDEQTMDFSPSEFGAEKVDAVGTR